MICATCGRENATNLVFCQECGQKLAPRVAMPTPPIGPLPGTNTPIVPAAPASATGPASPFGATALAEPGVFTMRDGEMSFGPTTTASSPAPPPSFPPRANAGEFARPAAPEFSFTPRGAPNAQPPQPTPSLQPKMHCVRCGAWNEVGLRFCVSCGNAMNAPEALAAPAPAHASAPAVSHAPLPAPAAAIAPGRVVSLAQTPSPATVRVCSRCRGACDGSAQFCRFCGAPLSDGPPATPVARPASIAANLQTTQQSAQTDPIPPPLMTSAPNPIVLEEGRRDMPLGPVAPTAVSLHNERANALGETNLMHGGFPAKKDPKDGVAVKKARLVIVAQDGAEGASFPVGDTTDIGRTEGHITLSEDGYLSPRHARITRRNDGRLVLRDLSSTNGTYIRLRAAKASAVQDMSTGGSDPYDLSDQDLFLVGQQVLKFEVVSDASEGFAHASEHGTLLFGTPAAPRYARLSQRTVEGVSRDVFYIRKAETVLGRESGDIVFTEDAFLSRRHAAIRIDAKAKRYVLADLGSSNGTFVLARGEIVLVSGDQFRIGQQLFRIDIA